MHVTQKIIADRVGVSSATVSMALRNDPQISDSRRDEILRVADELGYRPNPLVSSMMTHIRQSKPSPKRTGLLYLVSGPKPTPGEDGNTPELCFKGAVAQAARLGFHLEAFWIRQPDLTEKRIEKILRTRNIPGVIVGPREDDLPLPNLPWERLCSVMISYSFTQPNLDRVFTNFYNSTRLAITKIRQQTSKPIRLILPTAHDRNVHHFWAASYRQEQATQPNLLPPLIVDTIEPAIEWVQMNPGCVVLGTNPIFDGLTEFGLANAKDFTFFSLNLENRPELSGIKESSIEVGEEAANKVISRIYLNQTGIPRKPHVTLIEPSWQDAHGSA